MNNISYIAIAGRSPGFWTLLAGLSALILAALGSTLYLEHHGHWVTGMNNRVLWGIPHVFAIFLIIAASGALNVASIYSVFNKSAYQPLARLSGLVALALLAGGLMVLVLDLGRPDRLIIAITEYNFKSIFALNIIFYNGFFVIVAIYLWMMFERRMNKYSAKVGIFAFVWRLSLTTATGSIFALLVARHTYDAMIMAPKFIVMSFSFGLACFILVLMASYKWSNLPLGNAIIARLSSLLGVFVAAVLYFVVVFHIGNLYLAENIGVVRLLFGDGGIYQPLFWYGQIILGSILPLILLYHPASKSNRSMLGLAALLVIIGGFAQLYVLIIGGQAYPMELFADKQILSGYGGIAGYTPSLVEIILGVGGVALSLIIITLLLKFLPFLPASLADKAAENSHKN